MGDKLQRAIAFDLDGTLVNTFPNISTAINRARNSLGFSLRSEEEIAVRVGLPVEAHFDDLGLDGDKLKIVIRLFREELVSIGSNPGDLYPGVQDFLAWASSKEIELFVATSKPTSLAVQVLKDCEVIDFFSAVIGTDNGLHKPNPWVLNEVERISGSKLELFAGDRSEDAAAANSQGVPFVALLQSTHGAEDFRPYPVAKIFSSFQDFALYFMRTSSNVPG